MYILTLIILILTALFYGVRYYRLDKVKAQAWQERDQVSFLLENLNDGLIEYNKDFSIVRMNKSAEFLTGVSATEIVGKKVSMEDAEIPKLSALVRVSYPVFGEEGTQEKTELKTNNSVSIESHDVAVEYPQKRKFRVFTVSKIDSKSNDSTGFIKIFRDITKEDIISHSKSDLVAVAAHQIRTPLAGIKWVLSALMEGDYGNINDEQKKIIKRGLATNNDLVKLVDDILDVSKIEEAKFDYNFTKSNIIELLQTGIDYLRDKAATRNIALITDFPAVSLEVTLDAERLRMVIVNLIDNAITYSKEGGTVSITVKDLVDKVSVSVKDSGIGIPEKYQKRIFSKFFRATNAKQVKTHGTGLGLFLSKTVIEAHGGMINFKSNESDGTTFTFEIPKIPPEQTLAQPKKPDPEKVYGL